MKISGEHTFPCSASQVYQLLVDPEVLLHTLPGLKSLKSVGPHTYEAHIELGVAGFTSAYYGHIQMKNVHPPKSYTLSVEGDGPLGGLKANVLVNITPHSSKKSTVEYDGHLDVHGKIAGLGQKVLSGVASTLVHQFFRNLLKKVQESKEFQPANEKKRGTTTISDKKSKTPKFQGNLSKVAGTTKKKSTVKKMSKKTP